MYYDYSYDEYSNNNNCVLSTHTSSNNTNNE